MTKRSRFSKEQIIGILKEHQAGLGAKELCRKHGISDATFYKQRDDWVLSEEGPDRARKRFKTKAEATKGGTLEKALGAQGGSVRIPKEDGKIQEERTFPRSRDPKNTPG
ncbi:transposase [Roseobacter sp.]|uniref:transposase n=1 Tax=Roseobacter sp. TaxID=1907202 RepID=UPI002966679E|nr:transposase [Roseobacter sp.]MDW3183055.1 DUF2188 domain-containing protein [Roseobacter sp.]